MHVRLMSSQKASIRYREFTISVCTILFLSFEEDIFKAYLQSFKSISQTRIKLCGIYKIVGIRMKHITIFEWHWMRTKQTIKITI